MQVKLQGCRKMAERSQVISRDRKNRKVRLNLVGSLGLTRGGSIGWRKDQGKCEKNEIGRTSGDEREHHN